MAYLVYRKVVHRAVLQDEIPLVPMHKMSYFRRHVSTVWEKLLGSEVKI
ncbi:MAG: hypothetical protein JSS53_00790 [Proteobacteria bacterium]|nr:hypothetical protein [Pseudomonadota bacterium]